MINRRKLLFMSAIAPMMTVAPRIVNAQTRRNIPSISSNWRSDIVNGDPPEGLMPFNGTFRVNGIPSGGSGFPMANYCLIISVEIVHVILGTPSGSETALIGHWHNTKPTVDWISPEVLGNDRGIKEYPLGQQPEWFEGDFFDCHVRGNNPANQHYVDFNVCWVPITS